jgi:hypothetical protein
VARRFQPRVVVRPKEENDEGIEPVTGRKAEGDWAGTEIKTKEIKGTELGCQWDVGRN